MSETVPESLVQPLWLREDEVRSCITLNEAIDALAETLVLEARNMASNVPKALGTWGSSSLHALGALAPELGYAGFKTWANTPKGAMAVFSMFDAENGRLLALMEAAALGTLRTAGISGLATRELTDSAADEMSIVGTGSQALMQIAAISAVRRLKKVRVYSPTKENREKFAARAREVFSFEVVACSSVEEALKDSPIITLVTRANKPFVNASMIARGALINAAGAILPGKSEFEQDLFERASLIAVDNMANVQKNSTEFKLRYEGGYASWDEVMTLGKVIAEGIKRPKNADLMIFKPMGMGLSDLAIATKVLAKAVERGLGTSLEQGQRAAPEWKPLIPLNLKTLDASV